MFKISVSNRTYWGVLSPGSCEFDDIAGAVDCLERLVSDLLH